MKMIRIRILWTLHRREWMQRWFNFDSHVFARMKCSSETQRECWFHNDFNFGFGFSTFSYLSAYLGLQFIIYCTSPLFWHALLIPSNGREVKKKIELKKCSKLVDRFSGLILIFRTLVGCYCRHSHWLHTYMQLISHSCLPFCWVTVFSLWHKNPNDIVELISLSLSL